MAPNPAPQPTPHHVHVLALTPVQRGELDTVGAPGEYSFHSLLDYETLVAPAAVDFSALLDNARAQLDASPVPVDAIVTHWDFPASIIGPILAAERGLPAPSLTSLLKCEHKYWSRLEQRACVPECVPDFVAFDPFDDDPLASISLDFPFWVKPVKSHSSDLGFLIEDADDFAAALDEIRAGIRDVGDAFNDVLDLVELPAELTEADGNTCLAERFVTGVQTAPEGSMSRGEFAVHGVFDMHKDEAGTSFARLDYPADSVPEEVQRRMIEVTERFLRHIGFDDGCFNAEFMWDESTDRLWLIEVNTRISQSHSDLFAKVDGASNHAVAIDVALGRRPSMPHRKGRFAVASQCMVFHDEDAVVTRVPDEADKARIRERHGETTVTLQVQVGDRLSQLPHQDSYRYVVGRLYVGADDRARLVERHRAILDELPLEFAPVDEEASP